MPLPYYPLTNAGVNDAVKINADLLWLSQQAGLTGMQGVTGDPGGPPGATGVQGPFGPQGVTGLANYTQGAYFPAVNSVPHIHYNTTDDIWYSYETTSGSWIDISSGAKGFTGPKGDNGLANFKLGELPEVPSPSQPEFFWDESDETLYFYCTGAQAWVDITTGCRGITGLGADAGYTGINPTHHAKAAADGVLIESIVTEVTNAPTGPVQVWVGSNIILDDVGDSFLGGHLTVGTIGSMTGIFLLWGNDYESTQMRGIGLDDLRTSVADAGFTGLSEGYLPKATPGGKLINSAHSETGSIGQFVGYQYLVKRTDGSTQFHSAQLNIMRDDSGTTGTKNFEVTRLSFVGRDSKGNSQSYGSVRSYSTDPTDGAEAGTVSIDVGDSDAEQERLRVTRFGGIQAVYGQGFVVGDPLIEWTSNQCAAFGVPTGAQSATWEIDEIGMGGKVSVTDAVDGGMTVEGYSNKTSADTALTLIGRCVTTPSTAGAVVVDCCTQNGTGATATGINGTSNILTIKNGGTSKVAVHGDGEISDGTREYDILSECTFPYGHWTGISGYVNGAVVGKQAFVTFYLLGYSKDATSKCITLPARFTANPNLTIGAHFVTHNDNVGTWTHGLGYGGSNSCEIYFNATADFNQGLWNTGAIAIKGQAFWAV
jgi:hypothetical protein